METSFRQAKRLERLAAQMREHGAVPTFGQIWASGSEGRLFTSAPEKMPSRTTTPSHAFGSEPIRETTIPMSVEDAGVVAGQQLEARERAAAAKVEHEYTRPDLNDEMDPRRFPDMATQFPTEEAFTAWCGEPGRTPEEVARTLQVIHDQHATKAAFQELNRRIPTWIQDLADVIAFAEKTGTPKAAIRAWFKRPNADDFEAMHDRWKAAQRDGARETFKKHPRSLDAAADFFAETDVVAQPSAPTRARTLTAKERQDLVAETRALGLDSPKPWSEASVEKAGELFGKLIE